MELNKKSLYIQTLKRKDVRYEKQFKREHSNTGELGSYEPVSNMNESPELQRRKRLKSDNTSERTPKISLTSVTESTKTLNLDLIDEPMDIELTPLNWRPVFRSESTKSYRRPRTSDGAPITPIDFQSENINSPCVKRRKPNCGYLSRTQSTLRSELNGVRPLRRLNSDARNVGLSAYSLNRARSVVFRRSNSNSSLFLQRANTLTYRVVSSRVSKIKRCNSSVNITKRKEVAVGRKPSNTFQRRPIRRCSEPFLLDDITLQNKLSPRKQSTSRNHTKRRLSSAGTNHPTSSKQKLQALAKDELLASLNVPLTEGVIIYPASPDEEISEQIDTCFEDEDDEEKAKKTETERRDTKRLMIMEEILETEKNYISCLETLNAVFRNQLESTNIITEKDLNSLFPSHLNEIKTSHIWFMQELSERMNNDNWRGIIGDIFAKMTSASANLLDVYTAYVNAFPKSISTLSKCTRSSQKFRKFLEDCYENPVVERLDLPSFLLSPVQRLPRYILLLRELLKYTDEEHPDRYFISEAMKEMESLISSLNSSIHSSMEFYSASDSRRKKMTRQLTSKKRKQRASSASASKPNKKLSSLNETKLSADPDQGYCSFGEPRDESPEDETNTATSSSKKRSLSWRAGKRSMSMISSTSEESKNSSFVIRRPFGRNTDTRKSWRRSLGAVFSQLWSAKDENMTNSNNDNNNNGNEHKPKQKQSESPAMVSKGIKLEITASSDTIDGAQQATKRKNSSVRRKIAIVHTPPPDENQLSTSVGEDSLHRLGNMIRESSIDDDSISATEGAHSIYTSETSIIEERERRNSNDSSSSLKAPNSPQNFKRGKLRGSAGPVFKSIFLRNNTRKLKKTLSWDELNVVDNSREDKRQKRFSLRKPPHPSILKHHLGLTDSNSRIGISESAKSLNKDTISVSSDDTVSSRSSRQSSLKEEYIFPQDNNNVNCTKSKEKKNKFMKTLKHFVSKK